ncbi:MAG: pyruvate kinase alpha/beta domain-containing protein [Chloroflexota bacterium]
METKITYFAEAGQVNTEETFRLAKRRAEELGIKNIIVASTSGETGAAAAEFFQGYRVIAVSHAFGFRAANAFSMTEQNRARIQGQGGTVIHATHVFAGLGRAVQRKFNTLQLDDIVANVLRLFCQGMKVIPEIAMMAADAGLVRTDEEVIVIAGSNRGADTAAVVKPANSKDFFEVRIREVICKPRP